MWSIQRVPLQTERGQEAGCFSPLPCPAPFCCAGNVPLLLFRPDLACLNTGSGGLFPGVVSVLGQDLAGGLAEGRGDRLGTVGDGRSGERQLGAVLEPDLQTL